MYKTLKSTSGFIESNYPDQFKLALKDLGEDNKNYISWSVRVFLPDPTPSQQEQEEHVFIIAALKLPGKIKQFKMRAQMPEIKMPKNKTIGV